MKTTRPTRRLANLACAAIAAAVTLAALPAKADQLSDIKRKANWSAACSAPTSRSAS